MNVDDVEKVEVEGDGLMAIFARQCELMDKYHEIEVRNGTGYANVQPSEDRSVDLHDRHAQMLLKDFAWRVTEEITEATVAMRDHPAIPQHAQEEAADALHFLVELMILSRVAPDEQMDMAGWFSDELSATDLTWPSGTGYAVIEALGEAMNCLKQKPWKQTHILTDQDRYRGYILQAFRQFPAFAHGVGILTPDAMLDMYFRKSEVNKFRQRSNY